jgi:hypothetical protein
MSASRPISRLPRQILLAVSLLLVLGSQVIESGHLHAGGLDMPDCVQCQVDTVETLIGSMPAIASRCAESKLSASSPRAARALALLTPLPRGPPSLFS